MADKYNEIEFRAYLMTKYGESLDLGAGNELLPFLWVLHNQQLQMDAEIKKMEEARKQTENLAEELMKLKKGEIKHRVFSTFSYFLVFVFSCAIIAALTVLFKYILDRYVPAMNTV